VRGLGEWGAAGVGQSSWGPAVYGLVRGDEAAQALAARVREAMGARGAIYTGAFANAGARVWRAR
jgi:predicted sugar kinase